MKNSRLYRIPPASLFPVRGAPVLLVSLLALLALGPPALGDEVEGPCIDVPEYQGLNAIPPITHQIMPSSTGDTIVNDAEHPPGEGPKVVVGFWAHHEAGYEPAPGENPCAGEPTMKIAYPIEYGSERCYGWKHWDGDAKLHENSAKDFSCDGVGTFHYRQWTTMTCEGGERVGEEGTKKSASRSRCCRDRPPELWSLVLSGCGKEPPRPTEGP
ncbi:MAG: hypothetical protein MI919_04930 [Holophagales bacterium]|nr:hypothetical protein [Holophagales bacterium]